MSSPLVSVIITAFNRGHTIARAINSVLKQSLQDFEIIIVDDASNDNTIATIKELFSDPRIKLTSNQKNLGVGGAKNVGIKKARGKYIAFLDSDDEWTTNKLERQLSFMANNNDFPLSFTEFYVHRKGTNKVIIRQPRKHRTWLESLLYGETFSLGSTLITTKSCFETVGLFNEDLKRLEDRDWSIRYFDHYRNFQFLQEPLAHIHNSGWPEAEIVEHSLKLLLEVNEERLKMRGMYYFTLFDASLGFEAAVAHYRSGKKGVAFKEIVRGIYKKPNFLPYLWYRLLRKIKQRDKA